MRRTPPRTAAPPNLPWNRRHPASRTPTPATRQGGWTRRRLGWQHKLAPEHVRHSDCGQYRDLKLGHHCAYSHALVWGKRASAPESGQRTTFSTLNNAIFNDHPADAAGADLACAYYGRRLRLLSFPGNRPCCSWVVLRRRKRSVACVRGQSSSRTGCDHLRFSPSGLTTQVSISGSGVRGWGSHGWISSTRPCRASRIPRFIHAPR